MPGAGSTASIAAAEPGAELVPGLAPEMVIDPGAADPGATNPGAIDRSWGIVAASVVGLTFSLGTMLLYTFGVFVRPLTTEFGWSRTQLAGALALSQYSFALAAPVWGLLIDRFGPRAVVLPSVVCLALLVGSLSLLGSLTQYYLTFLAASFFAGGASPLGYSAVLVRKFERHLGLALGLAFMGVGLGATVLPWLSAQLMAGFGWREAYAGLGLLAFVCTVPAAVFATRGAGRPGRARAGVAMPIRPLVTSQTFVLICLIFVLLGTLSIGLLTSIVPLMVSRGFTPPAAAQLASLTGIAAIAGRGGIGWVLDRVHPPSVVAVMALAALGALLLAAYGSGPASGYAMAVLLGGVVGAEVDFTAFFVRRYFGEAAFGRLYGVAFGIFLIGAGSGPVLASASFDYFGSYQPGLLLFAAAALLVVLLTFAMPRLPAPVRQEQLAS